MRQSTQVSWLTHATPEKWNCGRGDPWNSIFPFMAKSREKELGTPPPHPTFWFSLFGLFLVEVPKVDHLLLAGPNRASGETRFKGGDKIQKATPPNPSTHPQALSTPHFRVSDGLELGPAAENSGWEVRSDPPHRPQKRNTGSPFWFPLEKTWVFLLVSEENKGTLWVLLLGSVEIQSPEADRRTEVTASCKWPIWLI